MSSTNINHHHPKMSIAREAYVHGVGSIPSLSITRFMEALLPNVSDDEVREGRDLLQEQGLYQLVTTEPRKLVGREEAVFDLSVGEIIRNLFDNAAILEPLSSPHSSPISENDYGQDSTGTRPDSFLVLKETSWTSTPSANSTELAPSSMASDPEIAQTGQPLRWCDVAVPCEWKKGTKKKDAIDNYKKVIWSMHHIMRDDPRRRFVFGLTIQNTDTNLWFCNRERIVTSEPFQFTKDFDAFLRVILAFKKCTPTQLGYDPTMRRIQSLPNSEPCYEISVTYLQDHAPVVKKFQTVNLLSRSATNDLLSRGTRVWSVTEVGDESNKLYVLKDTWIETTRPREGSNLRRLFESIKEQDDLKYFVEPFVDGDVFIGRNGVPDSTKNHRNGKQLVFGPSIDITSLPSIVVTSEASDGSNIPVSGAIPQLSEPPQAQKNVVRTHYRLVTIGVGVMLMNLGNRRDMMDTLISASLGVKIVHKAGWLVRDISMTNIIAVKDANGKYQAKLIDFEYYKAKRDQDVHSVRTGTLITMSTEVADAMWLHVAEAQNIDYNDPRPIKDIIIEHSRIRWPNFQYTALHDVESLWWILFWILVCLVSEADECHIVHHESPEAVFEQFYNLYTAFTKDRTRCFLAPNYLMDTLHAFFGDSHHLAPLSRMVIDSQLALLRCFQWAERGIELKDNVSIFPGMERLSNEVDDAWISVIVKMEIINSLDREEVQSFPAAIRRIQDTIKGPNPPTKQAKISH